MKILTASNWLKAPLDRDVIARWTVNPGQGMGYGLSFPLPADADRFTFLALGDSGDSEASGPHMSPQDAVGREMARDAALPGSGGAAAFVVHTGDVVYMTGERRLYDRNFRRPYAPFLTPESTVDNLIFRLPFLPVPGNHDYYDLQHWLNWLSRIPLLGAGVRAIAHELFAFSLPEGGSSMGKAYMQAFVNHGADTKETPLAYTPGVETRLPNRYYRFRAGIVDFFALDSNTLDGPPSSAEAHSVREEAAGRVQALEQRALVLNTELRSRQHELDRWREANRAKDTLDPERLTAISAVNSRVNEALAQLLSAVQSIVPISLPCKEETETILLAVRRWEEAQKDFTAARDADTLLAALGVLDAASDVACGAIRSADTCLAVLPEGEARAGALQASERLQQALHDWATTVSVAPEALNGEIRQLTEESLDVQREIALERRRQNYRPEDFDSAQLEWLENALAESVRDRPDAWRVVYLHHPLYTTISNHCERPDVQGLRANVLELFKDRVHLVMSGHSHAFEWFHSSQLPHTGIFVTGGGGQVSLRPSLLEPRRIARHRDRYDMLRETGVIECAMGGKGPAAADGEDGSLYHYLRIEVTPDVLRVHPVGVRRVTGAFRREEPMPVYHAPTLPPGRPEWNARELEAVEIRRGVPPRGVWSEGG